MPGVAVGARDTAMSKTISPPPPYAHMMIMMISRTTVELNTVSCKALYCDTSDMLCLILGESRV